MSGALEAETLACGTGATASALAAAVRSGSDCRNYRVDVEGGVLFVSFERTGDERFTNVTLTGPAQKVFEGAWRKNFKPEAVVFSKKISIIAFSTKDVNPRTKN